MQYKGGVEVTNNIEKCRKAINLSQEEVAKKVNIGRQYYNAIENGKRRPSIELAKKLAEVLKTDWTIFFTD